MTIVKINPPRLYPLSHFANTFTRIYILYPRHRFKNQCTCLIYIALVLTCFWVWLFIVMIAWSTCTGISSRLVDHLNHHHHHEHHRLRYQSHPNNHNDQYHHYHHPIPIPIPTIWKAAVPRSNISFNSVFFGFTKRIGVSLLRFSILKWHA